MRTLSGFDYQSQKPVARTVQEWHDSIPSGSRRRVEHGETFIHDGAGVLLLEVYGNLKVKVCKDQSWLSVS